MSQPSRAFQWKWVVISFFLYLLFYLLPLLYAGGALTDSVVTHAGAIFIGVWSFGGLLLISGLAGYLSTGITILEPALGAAGMVAVWFAILIFYLVPQERPLNLMEHLVPIGIMFVVFLVSLLGAWMGEQVQRIRMDRQTGSAQ